MAQTDKLIESVVEIAKALDGKNESQCTQTGNRLRDALGRIAAYLKANEIETGKELPAVTAANNGAVLKVAGGKWAIGTDADTAELPAVTAADNGSVLKVVDGAWAAVAETTPQVQG